MIKSLYEKHTSAERCSWGWRYRSAWGGGRKQEGWASRGVSAAPRWIHTAATSRASFRERNPPQEITRWFLPPRNPHFSCQTSPNLLLLLPLWRGSDPGRLRAAHVPRTTNSTGQRQPRCCHHLYAFILPFITHRYQIKALPTPLRRAPPFGCGHRQPQVTGRRNPGELTPAPLRDKQHGAELCPKSLCQNSRTCRAPVPAPPVRLRSPRRAAQNTCLGLTHTRVKTPVFKFLLLARLKIGQGFNILFCWEALKMHPIQTIPEEFLTFVAISFSPD